MHVSPMVFRIPLTKGYFAIVDEADFERMSLFKWHVVIGPSGHAYAQRYAGLRGRTRLGALMHKEIVSATSDQTVDHRSGDTLDNRRSNLRICTDSQNHANRRVVQGSSGFKGVSRAAKRWSARVRVQGKRIWLGVYDTPEEAARVYDRAAMAHFGEFAATNEMLGRYITPRAA